MLVRSEDGEQKPSYVMWAKTPFKSQAGSARTDGLFQSKSVRGISALGNKQTRSSLRFRSEGDPRLLSVFGAGMSESRPERI